MMGLRAVGLGLKIARAQRDADRADDGLLDHRLAFVRRLSDVIKACALLQEDAATLAADYASHVLKAQQDITWWQTNEKHLAEAWFIWRYAVQNGLIAGESETPDDPIIMKSEHEAGQAQIFIERNVKCPDEGRILICCAPATDVLRPLGFASRDGRYARRVDECAGGLLERAAEAGEALLAAGYTLTLPDESLRDLIAQGNYEPEKRYWVRTSGRSDVLRLSYPHDPTLHRYVCMAGGRWNGKYVEFPISCADRLDDLMRLYGFSVTAEAEKRIRLWKQALESAQTYRPRKKPRDALPRPEDMFRKMMARETVVPRDLLDDDV